LRRGASSRHSHGVEEEQGIYRGEVLTMMGKLADIDVNVRRIVAYIFDEEDEDEEEEEGDRPPDA
jgi:hypothetical protein